MVNKNIVFLSYGNEPEYLRAIFCILSLSSWICPSEFNHDNSNLRIVVYTDQPDFFQQRLPTLNIEYHLLTAQALNDMMDGTGFYHRRKIAVIDLTFKHYPDQDLFFIDTDTFFYTKPETLLKSFDSQTSFMHIREYKLADSVGIFSAFKQGNFPVAFLKYIKNREFVIGDAKETFTEDDYCWNSGVLGLSKDFAKLMPDALKLNDLFYKNSEWFISEQLAFGLILQRRTTIQPADDIIFHYWGKRQKALMTKLITQLFQQHATVDLINSRSIRRLTKRWHTKIANDVILEQAVISFQQKYWLFGIKKAVQVIFKDPLNKDMYKQLIEAATA